MINLFDNYQKKKVLNYFYKFLLTAQISYKFYNNNEVYNFKTNCMAVLNDYY